MVSTIYPFLVCLDCYQVSSSGCGESGGLTASLINLFFFSAESSFFSLVTTTDHNSSLHRVSSHFFFHSSSPLLLPLILSMFVGYSFIYSGEYICISLARSGSAV